MTVLTQVAGLPISINAEVEDLHYSLEEVQCADCGTVELADISPSLLNKSLMYPQKVYKCHRGVQLRSHQQVGGDLGYDVFYLPDGLLGIEYIKTHIFFSESNAKAACVVQVFSGVLTVIMQKNKPKESIYDIDSHVEEVVMTEVKSGEKLVVPAGYYYTFVNTDPDPVVFARVVRDEHVADYDALKRESGLAYYLISKNARQEIVLNPRYRTVPELVSVPAGEMNGRAGYAGDSETALYEEVVAGTKTLAELLVA